MAMGAAGSLAQIWPLVAVVAVMMMMMMMGSSSSLPTHDYGEALTKCILFFEGQRSGKLPSKQRMTWRKDSGLHDGSDVGVDLVGGYYDAGDNVKFNFPMAFSTTMLAWSVLEFSEFMGRTDRDHTLKAIRWGTNYLLKSTKRPNLVYVQVGDPYADHNCWQRPEDMDTPRTTYAINTTSPGTEVAAEMAAALASSSLVFKTIDPSYSKTLLYRAKQVFRFANKYRGSYNDSLGHWVCPFYCNFNGYMDELIWAAAWLFKVTRRRRYWSYLVTKVTENDMTLNNNIGEFGWDAKNAGINILVSKSLMRTSRYISPFMLDADSFVCTILPESPTKLVKYSPGGLLFKPGGSNMQHVTALSFLLLVHARHLKNSNRTVRCGKVEVSADRLIQVARSQADYILGSNPSGMSYMVGYGKKFPQRIHHRGSSLPSVDKHPKKIGCKDGTPYFVTNSPNQNQLTGAIVGGPIDEQDWYNDTRYDFRQSEPTTYVNAPFVGVLAFFKGHLRPT